MENTFVCRVTMDLTSASEVAAAESQILTFIGNQPAGSTAAFSYINEADGIKRTTAYCVIIVADHDAMVAKMNQIYNNYETALPNVTNLVFEFRQSGLPE